MTRIVFFGAVLLALEAVRMYVRKGRRGGQSGCRGSGSSPVESGHRKAPGSVDAAPPSALFDFAPAVDRLIGWQR